MLTVEQQIAEQYDADREAAIARNDERWGKGNWSPSLWLYMMEEPWAKLSDQARQVVIRAYRNKEPNNG